MNQKAFFEIDVSTAVHLPISERVLDRLADILFATDEILGLIRVEDRMPDPMAASIEAAVQGLYDQVNELMKRLAD